MPAKNVIKQYTENGYYHIYNRGVDKKIIFKNDKDYKIFLFCLKTYLSPPPTDRIVLANANKVDLSKEVKLLAFCLMPNHFHLLIWQKNKDGIIKLMRRLATKYVVYFNKKYARTGPLFQNIYKAVLVKTDEQLLHLSGYIHLNPLAKDGPLQRTILLNAYSSYKTYLGLQKLNWVFPNEIISFFKSKQKTSLKDILSYQSFVEDYQEDSLKIVNKLILD